jgi:hypothetical protein
VSQAVAHSRLVALAWSGGGGGGDPCSLVGRKKGFSRVTPSGRIGSSRRAQSAKEENLGLVAIYFPAEGATVRRLPTQRTQLVFERYSKIGLVGFGLGRRARSEARMSHDTYQWALTNTLRHWSQVSYAELESLLLQRCLAR